MVLTPRSPTTTATRPAPRCGCTPSWVSADLACELPHITTTPFPYSINEVSDASEVAAWLASLFTCWAVCCVANAVHVLVLSPGNVCCTICPQTVVPACLSETRTAPPSCSGRWATSRVSGGVWHGTWGCLVDSSRLLPPTFGCTLPGSSTRVRTLVKHHRLFGTMLMQRICCARRIWSRPPGHGRLPASTRRQPPGAPLAAGTCHLPWHPYVISSRCMLKAQFRGGHLLCVAVAFKHNM
jgi:hypothetical protein